MSEFEPVELPEGVLAELPAELAALLQRYALAEPTEADALEREIAGWEAQRAITAEWVSTIQVARGQLGEDRGLLDEILARPADSDDLNLVRGLVAELEGSAPALEPTKHRAWTRPLAVAAGLLLALGLGWRVLFDGGAEPGDGQDPILLGEGLEPVEPIGEAAAFLRFEWSGALLPPFGEFRLVVRAVDAAADSAVVVDVQLTEPSYLPSPSELAALAEAGRISWSIGAYDQDEHRFAWATNITAWLSGH